MTHRDVLFLRRRLVERFMSQGMKRSTAIQEAAKKLGVHPCTIREALRCSTRQNSITSPKRSKQ